MGRYNRYKKKKKREKKGNIAHTKSTCYWINRLPTPMGPKDKFQSRILRQFWTFVAHVFLIFVILVVILAIITILANESGQPTPTP